VNARSLLLVAGSLLGISLVGSPVFAAEANPQTFGAAMPAGPAQSIAQAINGFVASAAEPQKFSGRVARICRQKGCWMELEADGLSARVTMLDYGFFLPTDAHGQAEVFGTLSRVELDDKTAAHYAEDAGVAITDVARSEYQVVAHSVQLAMTTSSEN